MSWPRMLHVTVSSGRDGKLLPSAGGTQASWSSSAVNARSPPTEPTSLERAHGHERQCAAAFLTSVHGASPRSPTAVLPSPAPENMACVFLRPSSGRDVGTSASWSSSARCVISKHGNRAHPSEPPAGCQNTGVNKISRHLFYEEWRSTSTVMDALQEYVKNDMRLIRVRAFLQPLMVTRAM